jgi:large subunit ribosomal protein L37Ae
MSKRTKKSGALAKFGPRYGSGLKKKFAEVEAEQKATYVCTSCGKTGVEREAAGIWKCRYCGYTFAGGAYTPRTEAADIVYGKRS